MEIKLTRESNCVDPYTYVETYTCTNTGFSDYLKKDVHLSFMSGHSSLSAACLIYLVFYIQSRLKWPHFGGLVRNLYQAGLIFLVIYTGLSRISDYKHHWSDVLTGLIQGTLTATFVAIFVSDLIRLHTSYKQSDQSPGDNQVTITKSEATSIATSPNPRSDGYSNSEQHNYQNHHHFVTFDMNNI